MVVSAYPTEGSQHDATTDRTAATGSRQNSQATGGRELISPDLAKQLAKRGIVRITGHKWCRKEWNRPVKGATLWEVQLVN